MTDADSIVAGVAGRYATALFELAKDEGRLDETGKALAAFRALLEGSADLKRLVRSPAFSADEQSRAVGAVLDKAGIGGLAGNFVRLAARNRRLFAIEGMIDAFAALVARDRGEAAAEVTSAVALKPAQVKDLKTALKAVTGKDILLAEKVDPALLGGLVVKIGSRMIDSSIRTRLNSLKLRMKEVG